MSDRIRVETADRVGVIVIDRPEKRGALTEAMRRRLIEAAGELGSDDDLRAAELGFVAELVEPLDFREGVAAFIERREPAFVGRR